MLKELLAILMHTGFGRCAQPMNVEPIGKMATLLTIGRFGSFGLWSRTKNWLRIVASRAYAASTPIPPRLRSSRLQRSRLNSCYGVSVSCIWAIPRNHKSWGKIDLTVYIQFPKFMLPKFHMVQTTGDRLKESNRAPSLPPLDNTVQWQSFLAYWTSFLLSQRRGWGMRTKLGMGR